MKQTCDVAGACLVHTSLQTPVQSPSFAKVPLDLFKYLLELSTSFLIFYYNALTIFFRIPRYFVYFVVVDIATVMPSFPHYIFYRVIAGIHESSWDFKC